MQTETRPVFLSLLQIRLPVPGILSIAHRLSGLVLFLVLPFAIGLLDLALSGTAGFERARGLLSAFPVQVLLFLLLWALAHHLLAGIRYLFIDLDLGVQAPGYRRSAWLVILSAPVVAALVLVGLVP